MERVAFADESGTTDGLPCYTIGVVTVAASRLREFERHFDTLYKKHGVSGEVKWTRVRKSHGLINFTLEWLRDIFRSNTATFDAIVVNKANYRNWGGSAESKEAAFYQTYTYLLRHVVARTSSISDVYIDHRSDSYGKRHEMVESIGNSMLAQLESSGRLNSVNKVSSREYGGVQIADVLTGAINSSHIRFIDSRHQVNPGKDLAITRLARVIDWDDLCYDTFPHEKFNIWHFPIEYRGVPRSRAPNFTGRLEFVNSEDVAFDA